MSVVEDREVNGFVRKAEELLNDFAISKRMKYNNYFFDYKDWKDYTIRSGLYEYEPNINEMKSLAQFCVKELSKEESVFSVLDFFNIPKENRTAVENFLKECKFLILVSNDGQTKTMVLE